jgi:hypothetical protein
VRETVENTSEGISYTPRTFATALTVYHFHTSPRESIIFRENAWCKKYVLMSLKAHSTDTRTFDMRFLINCSAIEFVWRLNGACHARHDRSSGNLSSPNILLFVISYRRRGFGVLDPILIKFRPVRPLDQIRVHFIELFDLEA